MSRAKSPQAPLGSPDEIEHQFYEALQHGDIEKLMAVWSDDDDIACVHPGGPRVIGAVAIRASFDAMFANGAVNAHPEKVRRVQSLSSAVHSVLERVQVMTKEGPQSAWVIATNVYVKTGLGWRLVAHHASPGTPREVQEVIEAASILH
ncbi:YybH family protein [Piscinibacter sp.]|jgi:ketosteroid isomerase-like protein|uniref:YybH family protein n=1 Tax=Piscinibacter sp. TaxID=1903157 RepID=UPI00355AA789